MRGFFVRSSSIQVFLILALAPAGFGQSRARSEEPLLAEWAQAGALLSVDDSTGNVRFLGAAPGRPIQNPAARDRSGLLRSGSAVEAARGFLALHGRTFGLRNAGEELALESEKPEAPGRTVLRFRQRQGGVPVLGGELIVQLNQDRDILSIHGEILPETGFRTSPKVDRVTAQNLARAAVAKVHRIQAAILRASEPELWVYDPSLLGPGVDIPSLVWRMDVTAERRPIRELVLIDAERGSLALRFNQVPTTIFRETYDADNGTFLPGSLVCDESNPNCIGGDSHAVGAHQHAADTYDFFSGMHGRDSLDGAGMPLVSTVHYDFNYANAFWDGTQMIYGDACPYPLADDVVAHEFTHGVTDFSSRLFYYYQSGAINESLSDIWGEFVDLTNGTGNDSPAVRWFLGEDLVGPGCRVIRNMKNPPALRDPDRVGSPLFYKGSDGDNDSGGVHTNSGVNNKAAFLMTDGGVFNGRTVTGLGITKVAKVYYEVQTNLLVSGANYADLYDALNQACTNLLGTSGITPADCQEVRDAIDAVEMSKPLPGATPAPVCDGPGQPTDLFFDNIDDTGGVDFDNVGAFNAWIVDDTYVNSGTMNYFGSDEFTISDEMAQMNVDVPLPPGSRPYLRFDHAHGFEGSFDGGVLEYSTNGGVLWKDAGPLFDHNGYSGTIASGFFNPLARRRAFVGDSRGYISSRLRLASLAGQNVRFRFRIGTDESNSDRGWFVDDIHIYTCSGGVLQLNPAYTVGEAGPSANITVTRTGSTEGSVAVNYATSNGSAQGADYTPTNGTLTFDSGVASRIFSVPINNDTLDEPSETVQITLSSPTNFATLGPRDTAFLNITDNDVAGILQLSLSYSASEAAGTALINVTRSAGAASGVGVSYATSDGTAIAGSDYTAASGVLTFGAGELTKSFPVTITNDALAEGSEIFNVTIGTPTGGGALGARKTSPVSLVDDEIGLSFDFDQFTVGESAPAATITVRRTGPSTAAVGVSYIVNSGTATLGLDFGPAAGTLTLGSGVMSQSFPVPIFKDTLVEGTEAALLSLFAPTGGALLGPNSTAVLNLTDDDPRTLLKLGSSTYKVNESTPVATFTVMRLGPTTGTVGVTYTTSNGTATTAGLDYGAAFGTLSFGPGVKALTFNIPIGNDLLDEGDETFFLALQDPTGGAFLGTPSSSVVSILDNDAGGTLQLNLTALKVNETGGSVTATVLRSAGAADGVSVHFETSNGSAAAGSDYMATSGTLNFIGGELSKSILVPITNDGDGEANETLDLTLSAPAGGAVLGPRKRLTITIVDDEAAAGGTLQLGLPSYKTTETAGSLQISVLRTGGATNPVDVSYLASNGSASAGSDFTATSGTLNFLANERTKSFFVPILNDTNAEGTENFQITISNPTGGAILGPLSTAPVSISDNEGALQFSMARFTVGELRSAAITVSRNVASPNPVGVSYSATSGSATAGSDFTAVSGTLNFGPGMMSRTFMVPIVSDTIHESDETVTLTLSNPTGGIALGTQSTAVLDILDNDAGGTIQFKSSALAVSESGTALTVTVTRTGGTASGVTVDFASGGGSATAGVDYTPAVGSLGFAPGATSGTFTLFIVDDTQDEPNETLNLTLSNADGGASVGPQSVLTVTLNDNDVAGTAQFKTAYQSVLESNGVALVTVTRTGGAASAASVNYATSNGSASAGSDYTAASGTLTFAAGETSKTFPITILDNPGNEDVESIEVTLSDPEGGLLIGSLSTTVVFIVDND